MSQYFDLTFSKFLSNFIHKYSCQTTLVRMIEEWKQALDNGKMVGTVAAYLSKAFDSLPHGLLIAKSIAYGVDIKSCKLISSYLLIVIRESWLALARANGAKLRGVYHKIPYWAPYFSMFSLMTYFSWKQIAVFLATRMIIAYHSQELQLHILRIHYQKKREYLKMVQRKLFRSNPH